MTVQQLQTSSKRQFLALSKPETEYNIWSYTKPLNPSAPTFTLSYAAMTRGIKRAELTNETKFACKKSRRVAARCRRLDHQAQCENEEYLEELDNVLKEIPVAF